MLGQIDDLLVMLHEKANRFRKEKSAQLVLAEIKETINSIGLDYSSVKTRVFVLKTIIDRHKTRSWVSTRYTAFASVGCTFLAERVSINKDLEEYLSYDKIRDSVEAIVMFALTFCYQ